jgi:transposase-like protein
LTLVTDLREIERLYDQLLAHALFGGNNGRLNAAAPIPGGAATVALSPWSSGLNSGAYGMPEHIAALRMKEHYGDKWCEERHPLLTLATWSMVWREWFGHTEPSLRITVRSASTYLRLNAEAMEHDHHSGTEKDLGDGTVELSPDFDEMARDVAGVKAMLENIVLAGIREERSQVPCLDCGTVRLVKRYTKHAAADHWLCPKCKRRYSDPEYHLAQRQHLASQGADQFVSLSSAAAAVGRSVRTVRRWTSRRVWDKAARQWQIKPGKVRSACDAATRLPLVYWPDVRDHAREQAI